MTTLLVPSSYGEALDRLTILQLKLDNIKDSRRQDVEREFNALKALVLPYLEQDPFHYDKLLEVNRIMWKIQDDLHTKLDKETEYKTMLQINIENERRFRIKRTLNDVLGSVHKEQKGYARRRCFVLSHLGMGDHLFMNGAIRYLASLYDEVTVVCKMQYEQNLKDLFSDEPAVTLYVVGNDREISPRFGAPFDVFSKAVQGYEKVFLLGYHGEGRVEPLPYAFYDEMGLDRSVMTQWANYPCTAELKSKIPEQPFRFVHLDSSNLKAPVEFSIEDMLTLDPVTNRYPPGHHFYEDAQKWVGLPLKMYPELMKAASSLVLIDSSFFCMSLTLGIPVKCVYVRNGRTYKHIRGDLNEIKV